MSRIILTGFLFFVMGLKDVTAQNYAIQSTVILNPPYTLSLPQYSMDPDRIQVQLMNKDFATPLVEVFLQLRIEGPGITLETKSGYRPAYPLSLTAGVPVMLNGADLGELFNINNLNVEGLNPQQFMAGGSYLPEGLYRFSVWAKTYHQNLQISNVGFATAGIFRHQPPIINLPLDRSFISIQNPQFLQIQFTPRHTISPELISKVRYKIRMTEVMPSGRNPNEAMQSTGLPFFETITDQTSFIFGPGEPAMVEGRTYAIQVQAIDVDGKDLFDNRGYSEVVSFVYGGQCPIPQNLQVFSGDGSNIDLRWDANEIYRSYIVNYRIKGEKYFKTELAFNNVYSIHSCIPDKEYEIKVSGVCSENESESTPALYFKTNNKESAYSKFAKDCGKPLPSVDLTNKNPLVILQSGDIIKAADFEIKVTAANGGNGVFSGTGLVTLPFTGKIPMPCTFEKVFLNTDKRLIAGKISLLQQPFEISDKTITNIGKTWRTLFGKNWNRYGEIQYGGVIKSVTEDPDGYLIVEGDNGKQRINRGSNVKITDKNGKSWYISRGGKVSEAEGPLTTPVVKNIETGEGTPSTLPPGMAKLFFFADVKDGYDAIEHSQLTAGKTYDRMESPDTAYYAGWKLVRAGEKIQVNAIIVQGKKMACPLDSIRFLRSDGTVLPFKRKGSEFTINLTGRMHLYADAIWAVANYGISSQTPLERWILGKINLINVDVKKQDIVLVPVNSIGSSSDEGLIQSNIDKLLGAYAIQSSVVKDRGMSIKDYDAETEILEADKTFIHLGYSEKLTRFIEAYKLGRKHLQSNYSNDTVYLFLLNKSTEETKGFMLPGEKFGFIFLNNTKIPDAHTITHEVGHGAFGLEHVFGSDLSKAAQSQNLLDYAAPYSLLNYGQWMQIHDPEIKIWGFGKEDKGKYITVKNTNQFRELANADGTYTFISHSGEYITLLASAENLVFSTLNRGYFEVGDGVRKPGNKMFPLGCLTAFRISGIDYHALEYEGYVSSDEVRYISKWPSSKFPEGIMVYSTFCNGVHTAKAAKYESVLRKKTETQTGGGKLLSSFAVIEFEPASLNMDFTAYMVSKRKGGKSVEHLDGNFGILGNDGIDFQFNDTTYNASGFLVKILSEQKTVSDYIYFFNLVNLRTSDYYSFVQCLNDKIEKRAIRINAELIAKRRTQKGESTVVTQYINTSSENMFAEVYKVQLKDLVDIARNGSVLSEDIKKATAGKWKAEALFGYLKRVNYSKCQFTALELEDRLYAINLLIENSDYWRYGDVNLITWLLTTTPSSDAPEIMKKGVMKNQFRWLYQLWYNREEEDVSENFQLINDWLYEYYEKLEIIPSRSKLEVVDLPSLALEYDKSQNEFLIGIKEKTLDLEIVPQKFSIYCNGTISSGGYYYNSNPGEVTLNENGSISFRQTYRVDDLRPQIYDPQKPQKLRSVVDYEESFNPFEIVSVTLGGNYFPLKLKAGQTLEMPAFMALQLQEKLKLEQADEQTRILTNKIIVGVSVISAVYTGGASLTATTGLLMATLTADNAITDYKSSIKTQAEWDAHQEFFSDWDALNTAAQFALSIEDVYSLGKMIIPKIGGRVNFIKSWNRFKNKFKDKILKKKLTDIVEDISENALKTEFKVGDKILDCPIKQIRQGTNGKVAFIARGMGGDGKIIGVKDIYNYLINKGYDNVEIFDEISLNDKWKKDFLLAQKELKDLTKDGSIQLSERQLKGTLMYKLDEAWMDMLLKEGYTIIDFDDLYLKAGIIVGESPFYNMEILKAFGK